MSKLPNGKIFASGKFLATALVIRFTINARTSSSALVGETYSTKASTSLCSLKPASVIAFSKSRPGFAYNSATFVHLSQSVFAIQGACRGTFSIRCRFSPYRSLPISRSPSRPLSLLVSRSYSRTSRDISPDFLFFPLFSTSPSCFP